MSQILLPKPINQHSCKIIADLYDWARNYVIEFSKEFEIEKAFKANSRVLNLIKTIKEGSFGEIALNSIKSETDTKTIISTVLLPNCKENSPEYYHSKEFYEKEVRKVFYGKAIDLISIAPESPEHIVTRFNKRDRLIISAFIIVQLISPVVMTYMYECISKWLQNNRWGVNEENNTLSKDSIKKLKDYLIEEIPYFLESPYAKTPLAELYKVVNYSGVDVGRAFLISELLASFSVALDYIRIVEYVNLLREIFFELHLKSARVVSQQGFIVAVSDSDPVDIEEIKKNLPKLSAELFSKATVLDVATAIIEKESLLTSLKERYEKTYNTDDFNPLIYLTLLQFEDHLEEMKKLIFTKKIST